MFNISIGGNPTPLWAMADYALMCYRYVSIPLHVTSRAHALMHSRYLRVLTDLQLAMPVLCDIMRESGVKAAIVSYELLDKLTPFLHLLPSDLLIILVRMQHLLLS